MSLLHTVCLATFLLILPVCGCKKSGSSANTQYSIEAITKSNQVPPTVTPVVNNPNPIPATAPSNPTPAPAYDVNQEVKDINEFNDWFKKLKDTQADREKKTNELRNELELKLRNFISALPARQSELASKLNDQRNVFINDGYSIPTLPELKTEALVYIKKRSDLEKEFEDIYLTLVAKVPAKAAPGDVILLKQDVEAIRKLRYELELMQTKVNAWAGTTVVALAPMPAITPKPAVTPEPATTPEKETPINKDWKVKADPGAPWPQFPEKLPYTELSGIVSNRLIYPAGPTRFLMAKNVRVVNDVNENILVGDLLTGKPLGLIRNVAITERPTLAVNRAALSGDGVLLAHHDYRIKAIRVLDVKTGKEKRTIPYDVSSAIFQFVKPTILLAVRTESAKESAAVWDVETGKEICSFKLSSEMDEYTGWTSVSPGGRYLAVPLRTDTHAVDRLQFYDLTTGKLAGELKLEGANLRTSTQIKAVAFSPDGNEIAAVVFYPNPVNVGAFNPCITIWSLASGRELSNVLIDRQNYGMLGLQGTEPLQWFPDQKAFLIAQTMVTNRADGKLLEYLKGDTLVDPYLTAKVIDNNRIMVGTHLDKLIVKTVKR